MSETLAPSRRALIVGLLLLLIGVAGLAMAFVGLLGILTDDLSCTYSPRCGINTVFLMFGAVIGVLGMFGGVVLVRRKRIASPVPPPVPMQQPGGHPAWALICGAIALAVAMVCGFLALNWVLGYLSDASNPFAGLALLLGLGAGVVAAGFLILGIMLLAKKS